MCHTYRKSPWVWVSLSVSAFATVATGFNPLVLIGVVGPYPPLTKFFGYFIGTVIMARGPNYVSDFFGTFKSVSTAIKG